MMQQDSDWLYLSLDPMTVTYKVIYSCHMPRVSTTYVVCASCRLPNYAITSISSNRKEYNSQTSRIMFVSNRNRYRTAMDSQT